MTTTTTPPSIDAVRRAVADVADPELPPVTVGMLGMIHDVSVSAGGDVIVELLPTYSGCPATEMISRDVTDAVRVLDGVGQVQVGFRFDPPWSAERIDATGRERLREFGIAPPGGELRGTPQPAGRRTLPLAITPVAPGSGRLADDGPRPCPYCGSDATERDSAFGPTPCRDVRYCTACAQPFEAFKSA